MHTTSASRLVHPALGLNHTPAMELQANLLIAHTGVMSLLLAVQEAAPKEHDFSPQDHGALGIATMENAAICRALLALESEIDALAEVVGGSKSPADLPDSKFPALAAAVADQPGRFPVLQGGTDKAALKDRAAIVYRCAQTVMGEFRPATPDARDYQTEADYRLARAQHQARLVFVERVGHWFLLLAKAAS